MRMPPGLFAALAMTWAMTWAVTWSMPADAGTVTRQSFPSRALDRDYVYSIYLPDGYGERNLRYPVLYLLHGSTGDENSWPVQGKAQQTMDRLIEDGEIPPMIVVMPSHSESWWVDGNNEPAGTALMQDLIPHVEATYDTIAARSGRLIGGLSAGGYGTVNAILEHPGMFAAGAALSPAIYDPVPPATSSAHAHAVFQTEGTFDPEVWKRLNWPRLIDRYKAGGTVVPLYVNSGDHDGFDIAYHAANFYQRLREHQPDKVEYRVVDGGHEWPVWERTLPDAVTYMSRFVSRPRGAPAAVMRQ